MERAFTIVELVIVIVVMGILLTLGVVGLAGTQVQARDSQRQGNMEALATNLEKYYSGGVSGSSAKLSRYPATVTLVGSGANNSSASEEIALLPDLGSLDSSGRLEVLIDPNDSSGNGSSLRAATNTSQTTPTPTPSSSNYIYVYQPFQANGSLCTSSSQECVRFNLYYYKESTGTIEKITSRHQ